MTPTLRRVMLEAESLADILMETEWSEEANSLLESIAEAKDELEDLVSTVEHSCGTIRGFVNLLEPAATDEELGEIEEAIVSLEKCFKEEDDDWSTL